MPISDLRRDLLAPAQVSGLGAATPLYDRFASGIRSLMRHHLPGTDPSTGVFHALVTAAQAQRRGQIRDDDQLVSQVRAAAKAFIEQSRGAPIRGVRRKIRQRYRTQGQG